MKFLHSLLFLLSFHAVFAQVIEQPMFGSSSHKTLKIEQIEFTGDYTILSMSVENQKTDGDAWFCADKEIFLKNSNGEERFDIIKKEGIPTCPEQYKFKEYAEILYFKLYFPKIPRSIQEVDLVESCAVGCMHMTAIVLDKNLDNALKLFERGTMLYRTEKKQEALDDFLAIAKLGKFKERPIYAYSLYIIPKIFQELDKLQEARTWFASLQSSNVKNKAYFVNKLREIAFFRDLP